MQRFYWASILHLNLFLWCSIDDVCDEPQALQVLFHTLVTPFTNTIMYLNRSGSDTLPLCGLYFYLFSIYPHILILVRSVGYFATWRPILGSSHCMGLIVMNCTLIVDDYCFPVLRRSPRIHPLLVVIPSPGNLLRFLCGGTNVWYYWYMDTDNTWYCSVK